MTSEPSPLSGSPQMELLPIQSAADSPARTSAQQGTAQGSTVSNRVYGANMPDLLARYDRSTSLWRTSQHCLGGGLDEFSETWPRSGTMRSGIAFQLPPLVYLMSEIACGLLPTPRKDRAYQAYSSPGYAPSLTQYLTGKIGRENNGLKPNPEFVELMMGFPIGHTELKPSETPSSRKSPRSSGER